MTIVWGIHNDKIPASQLVDGGFVSLGWDELGDLRHLGDDQVRMKEAVTAAYPSAKTGAIPGLAGYLRRFAFDVAIGDLVVAPSKQQPVYNIGRVTGDYEFRAEAALHRHRRPVEWLVIDAPREAFSQSARYEMGSSISFFQVANHAEEFVQAVEKGVPSIESDNGAGQVRYGLLQRTALEVLRDHDPRRRREVIDEIAARLELNEAELQRTKGGQPRYEPAITFGSTDMRAAGWIDKTEDGWTITDAGRRVLDTTPATTDLSRISSAAYREMQAAKRATEGRFKTARYPLIDSAVKLIGEGQWITYGDIAAVVGANAPSVGEYVHNETVGLDGHHRVVPAGQPPYRPEWRAALEAEGVEFDDRGLPDVRRRVTAEDLREEMDLLGLLPTVPRRAWLVRGNSINGKDLVPGWLDGGRVSLAATNLRAVDGGISRDDLKPIVDEDYAHASYDVKGEKLDEFHAFLTRMQDGDLVVTVDQGRLYVGTLAGETRYQQSSGGDSNLVRDVDWVDSDGIAYADLPPELAAKLKVQRDVVDLTQQRDTIEGLLDTEIEQVPPPRVEKVVLNPATPDLSAELHVSQAWLQECIDLLNDRPQLIFYGPPGTGKTYLAQAIAKHVAGENVRLVQFHPAYSYEDFFEGYRPTEEGGFKLKPGPLRKVVSQARENPRDAHVLIIDEINRGNLAKVFGELYFLLEYRKDNVELLYADEEFNLPENVFIIGTMNTADRSIALVDAAMRRRFAFLPLHPSEDPTNGILRSWMKEQNLPSHVADLHDELNRRIEDSDFKIGPSYFMRKAVHEGNGLERTWRTSILPLLEEHHFGELDGKQVAARYGLAAVQAAVAQADVAAADTGDVSDALSDAH
ncbi:AAA family ATPase [Nocardioides sp. T5]|uniref:AAA family ATPase n=1 Tax=Nocardioides sp. T5 TaxID=3400182 RepID=UPI003A8C788B